MQFGDRQLVDVNACTLGYGMSLSGARRILYELALHEMDRPTELMFRAVCDGDEGRSMGVCFSVQPQLFQHHRAVGSRRKYSDITEHGNGFNEVAFTRNERWSTRLNLGKLVNGDEDYIDQFRDGEPATALRF